MTPLEQMTKAHCEVEWGPGSWDLVSSQRRKDLCMDMRAALEEAGFVLMPKVPTDEMISAGQHVMRSQGLPSDVYAAFVFAGIRFRENADG